MRLVASTIVAGLFLASASGAAAQTPSAPKPATDIYHVHFTKAAPGQAAALGKEQSQPDPLRRKPRAHNELGTAV